jgi:ABC-type glycerol-3-phosphate transport system permease component
MKIKKGHTGRFINRSRTGSAVLFGVLLVFALFMATPFMLILSNSLKPLNELWEFPPRLIPREPTLNNFRNLMAIMSNSLVPFFMYIGNTVFVTVAGTVGNIVLSSMCAYPLSRYKFPGSRGFFTLVRSTLMFSGTLLAIPNFIIISKLHLIDSYLAVILPQLALPLGLFIMKQFMDQMIPMDILESGQIDGATEPQKFLLLVMPLVRPAWLTLMIFLVNSLWTMGSTPYIYSEQLKPLNYALDQIVTAGVARAGVGAASTVLIIAVPLIMFIISQSSIIETMSTSGMKD